MVTARIRPKKTIAKPAKSLPTSSKVIRKSATVHKSSHFMKPALKTVPKEKIIKSASCSERKSSIRTNLSHLKSKSFQNLTDTKAKQILRKNSYPNLNELNTQREQAAKTSSFDAIKLLAFLIQKAKQSSDSKNVTFDSLFNELNLMNKKLTKSKSANLDSSLDIKLDQMENEIEILRTQLNQNCTNFLSSPKKLATTTSSNKLKNINSNNYDDILKLSNDNEKIVRLQNELKESNKKCQVLEYLLEQKNKQTEKYNFLFK